jgi:4-hydroxybenzoate polyprenyltransferase
MAAPVERSTGSIPRAASLADLVRLARPHHWVKNLFVLLPMPFALADRPQLGLASLDWPAIGWGLLGFSLVNSAIYTLNDLIDATVDRRHPRKRNRPIASGRVSPTLALVFFAALLLAGVALSALAGSQAVEISLLYVAINAYYCLQGKSITLVDVFLLSSGYVLRVLLGCVLIDAPPSPWLLVCTSSLSLFLALIKRRADVLAGLGAEHRASLTGYNLAFLDQAVGLLAGVTLVSYMLYTIDAPVLIDDRRLFSVPFVAFGVLNYLRMVQLEGAGASPVEMFYRSRSTQICVVGWVAAVLWALQLRL